MFSNPNISVDAKRADYEGLILSILLYGVESWCLTKKLFSMLRIFHNRCVRSMCRVTVTECYNLRISNEEILRRLNSRKIDDYITKRQLRWAGHVARMELNRHQRKMLSSWVCNKCPIGAPEFAYGHGLYKSLTKAGVDVKNWHEITLEMEKNDI